MSRALITEAYLTDISDAIRAKNGSSDTYTPPQMAAAIQAIPTGGGGMPLATKVGTLHDGWYFTSGGVLRFDGSDTILDVFSVQAGHKYVFCYGATAGNRGTIAFTTTNIFANPQDGLALTLIHIIDSSNRKSYYSETIFDVSQNGYIGAYIGLSVGQNISAYLIDITDLS